MAVFVPGTRCPICGLQMTTDDEIVMFSPFVANRLDPVFTFSDAAFHATCFAQHPLSAQAMEWHEESKRSVQPGNRICAVCGEPILDPDDYFGTGLLTSDRANPLFEFNFVLLHRSHAGQWNRLGEFRRRVEEVQASDAWKGPKLVFGAGETDVMRWI